MKNIWMMLLSKDTIYRCARQEMMGISSAIRTGVGEDPSEAQVASAVLLRRECAGKFGACPEECSLATFLRNCGRERE